MPRGAVLSDELLQKARDLAEKLHARGARRTEWNRWLRLFQSLSDLNSALRLAADWGREQGLGQVLRKNERKAFRAIAEVLGNREIHAFLMRLGSERGALFAYIGWWLTILEKGAPRP